MATRVSHPLTYFTITVTTLFILHGATSFAALSHCCFRKNKKNIAHENRARAQKEVELTDLHTSKPLIDAAHANDTHKMRTLWRNGVDPNWFNRAGETALMHASFEGHKAAVMLLIMVKAQVNAPDNVGFTSLLYAANQGHEDVVALLLSQGASAHAKSYGEGFKAIDWVSKRQYPRIFEMLTNAIEPTLPTQDKRQGS